MRVGRRIGLGIIPVLIGLYAIIGSIEGTIFVLTLSIVCTVGIGAAFWLFLAFLVGGFIEKIIIMVHPSYKEQQVLSEMGRYVRDARSSGMNDGEIRDALLKAGWSDEKINVELHSEANPS